MRQTLFTSYANLSLRNNPKELELFFQVLNKYFSFEMPASINLASTIIYFASAEGKISPLKTPPHIGYGPGELQVAFEAVYGYRDGYCMYNEHQPPGWKISVFESECVLPGRHALIDRELFRVPDWQQNRLKCFECEQFYLIAVLKEIIEGKDFSEIIGLEEFLNGGIDHKHEKLALGLPIDGGIIGKGFYNEFGKLAQGPDEVYPYKHLFNRFIRSIIAYDLSDFLDDDERNRNRIKCCSQCNIFYISETATKRDPTFCEPKCRYDYHNEKRKQNDIYNKNRSEKRKNGFYQT